MSLDTLKQRVHAVFEDPRTPSFRWFNDLFALVTIVSIVAGAGESVFREGYAHVFFIIEWATVLLFTLEYGLRIWSSHAPRAYIFSFFGLIDLIAIVPTYLGLGTFTFLKAARVLRIMRLARIVGQANLTRVHEKGKEVFGHERFTPFRLGVALLFTFIISVLAFWFCFGDDIGTSDLRGTLQGTLALFLGLLPVPEIISGRAALLLMLGKIAGFGTLGLIAGVIGEAQKRHGSGRGE